MLSSSHVGNSLRTVIENQWKTNEKVRHYMRKWDYLRIDILWEFCKFPRVKYIYLVSWLRKNIISQAPRSFCKLSVWLMEREFPQLVLPWLAWWHEALWETCKKYVCLGIKPGDTKAERLQELVPSLVCQSTNPRWFRTSRERNTHKDKNTEAFSG